MSDWRKYGEIITVGGGIAIAGALWFAMDGGRSIRGEDWAETAAAIRERIDVVQPGWSGDWQTNQNYMIGSTASRAQIDVLRNDILTEALTDNVGRYWCLGSTIPNGDCAIIAQGDSQMTKTIDQHGTTYGFTTVSNAYSDVICAVDRVYDSQFNYSTNAYPDRTVGVDLFYSSAVGKKSTSVGEKYNWWNYIGNGTNTYQYQENTYFYTTNILNEIANVVTNLTSTIAYVPIQNVEFDLIRRYEYGTLTNRIVTVEGEYKAFVKSDYLTAIKNNFEFSKATYPTSWYGIISDIRTFLVADSLWRQTLDGDDQWVTLDCRSSYDVVPWGQFTEVENVSFVFGDNQWPSIKAFQNGYVKKYRVYAVTTASVGIYVASGLLAPVEAVKYYTVHTLQPNHYESRLLGMANCVCALPNNLTVDPAANQFVETVTMDNYNKIKLDLIYSINEPSQAPRFDVGATSAATTSLEFDDFGWREHELEYHPDDFDTDIWSQTHYLHMSFDNKIRIRGFIVVVDWDFNHLNPDKPFTPAIYTPTF